MLKGRVAGRLDVRLSVEQPVKTANSIGENALTWEPYKTMFVERVNRDQQETVEARQPVGRDQSEFRGRFDAGLTTRMRFRQDTESTYFYIISVQSDRREDYSNILAERRDSQ